MNACRKTKIYFYAEFCDNNKNSFVVHSATKANGIPFFNISHTFNYRLTAATQNNMNKNERAFLFVLDLIPGTCTVSVCVLIQWEKADALHTEIEINLFNWSIKTCLMLFVQCFQRLFTFFFAITKHFQFNLNHCDIVFAPIKLQTHDSIERQQQQQQQ